MSYKDNNSNPSTLSVEETQIAMQREEFQKRILDKYQDKAFTEDNKWWYNLCLVVAVLCNILNFITGASAIKPYFQQIFGVGLLGLVVAWAFAAGIPVLLEYAQWRNGIGFWERYFFKRNIKVGKAISQVAITAIVVFLSYQGAPELVKAVSSDVEKPTIEQQDKAATVAYYDKQIKEAQSAANEFKRSRSWLGKLSVADGKGYKDLLEKVSALRTEMNDKIAEIDKSNKDLTNAGDEAYKAAILEKSQKDKQDSEVLAIISIITALLFNVMLFKKELYEYTAFFEFGGKLKESPTGLSVAHKQAKDESLSNEKEVAELLNAYKNLLAEHERLKLIADVRNATTPTPPYKNGSQVGKN